MILQTRFWVRLMLVTRGLPIACLNRGHKGESLIEWVSMYIYSRPILVVHQLPLRRFPPKRAAMKRLIHNRCHVAVIFLFTIVSVAHGATIGSRSSDEWAADSNSFGNKQESNSSFSVSARQGPDRPECLRILPLGASIVRGFGPNGAQTDGFRKAVRDRLRQDGYKVNMVESQ
jgi:hypothetical protein